MDAHIAVPPRARRDRPRAQTPTVLARDLVEPYPGPLPRAGDQLAELRQPRVGQFAEAGFDGVLPREVVQGANVSEKGRRSRRRMRRRRYCIVDCRRRRASSERRREGSASSSRCVHQPVPAPSSIVSSAPGVIVIGGTRTPPTRPKGAPASEVANLPTWGALLDVCDVSRNFNFE